MRTFAAIVFFAGLLVMSCSTSKTSDDMPPIQELRTVNWGQVDGQAVNLYTLANSAGTQVKITNYGGIIVSWMAPDRDGNLADIVLGFDSLSEYLTSNPFFGALVGRYANRIAHGEFELDGAKYTLVKNNGENHLHGGTKGFDKQVWDVQIDTARANSLVLTYTSPDMEEGYPGTLHATVRYTLTEDNALEIEYGATTDKPTIVNLTNHSYFNLSGNRRQPVLGHVLQINADRYTPADNLIPTGQLAPVAGTPYDFLKPHTIGGRLPEGYDMNFCLNTQGDSLIHAATVIDSASGRKLEVFTTQPGVQLYTANYLDGSLKGSDGTPFTKHAAFCLETQHFPDSPNKPDFPSTRLDPGQVFRSKTIYRTSVVK